MLLFGKERQASDLDQVKDLRKGDPKAFSDLYIAFYKKLTVKIP